MIIFIISGGVCGGLILVTKKKKGYVIELFKNRSAIVAYC